MTDAYLLRSKSFVSQRRVGDADGFHPINVGRMSIGLPCYVSATPNGILELLKRYRIETSGKKCVVLGRSNIVGKPMAALMMQKAYPGDATVTVCHSRSKDLVKECREADIIIAALGQPNFVKAEMVKEGAVVIDVGTTRVPDASKKSGFKLTGDVKFDEVSPKSSSLLLSTKSIVRSCGSIGANCRVNVTLPEAGMYTCLSSSKPCDRMTGYFFPLCTPCRESSEASRIQ